MSETPALGPVPERIAIQPGQVAQLIAEQFPQWSGLAVTPVAPGGWDNRTFRLGSELLVRLPSAAPYAEAVDKEHRWLPVLAAELPLPIPVPLARGRPGVGYPYPWSVYRWLPGSTATAAAIADPVRFAVELADFLTALQRVDATDGPQPGLHNWYRGGPLRTFAQTVRGALAELSGVVDVQLAGEVWAAALAARWDGADRWVHGDVARGNLLVRDGELAAVIDFGTCGVGDPACDLAVAWTLLTAGGRRAFRDRLGVDPATWARGRGWALWKCLAGCAAAGRDPAAANDLAGEQRVLEDILADPAAD